MNIRTTFGYWLTVAKHTDFQMEKFDRPHYVGRHRVPENLNNISIGQLIELGMVDGGLDSFAVICKVLLGLTIDEVSEARAVDVVQFCGWVTSEVERINKLFEQLNAKPSDVEQRAGIKNLQFGLFGMLDWYAQRMGYQDQEQVKDVPWLRIYKCMDMDAKRMQFQKRIQEIIADDYRRKMQRGGR